MSDTFEEVQKGDRLTADMVNDITDTLTELMAEGPPAGQNRVSLGGVRAQASNMRELLMVRITAVIVPESSALYADSLTYRTDVTGATGAAAYNSALQVWDSDASQWADDPSGECVEVAILDDAIGWRPLVIGDRIPVQWKKTASRYVPLENRETAVVFITDPTPDASGFYLGISLAYSSESLSWITKGTCYIIDIGQS